ncbi:MAG: cupin domain-containing protein [Deltaproteobacteria bacterium]|nr:cupin domain-containing protein [Deltaproteobacteria bacterium]
MKEKESESYDDFLHHLSRLASKDEEQAFMDSLERVPDREEDIPVRVGEKVKKVREQRGLSLVDISRRTGLDEPSLLEIEEGTLAPPLGTVIKLAKALEMKMGYFISGDENKAYTIVRHSDRKMISRFDSKKGKHYGYEYESLAPYKKDRHMEPFLVTLQPAATEEERSTHDGQEFIFVLTGKMEVRLGVEIHVLEPGDSIYYDSTVPHLVKCHGGETTRILAVLYAEK